MNNNRFILMVFQLFIILKLYDLWHYLTGFTWESYFIIVILLIFTVINLFFKNHLSRNIPSLLPFKLTKYSKTGNSTDLIFICSSILILGFIIGHYLTNIVLYLIIFLGLLFRYILINVKKVKKILRNSSLAFIMGLLFTTPLSNNIIVIILGLLGNFILYVSSDVGQF